MKTEKRFSKNVRRGYSLPSVCFILPAILLIVSVSCSDNLGDYDATGTFDAEEILVSSEVAGAIVRLDVTEGDKLEQGQEVGLVDTLQLYLQRQQLKENIRALKTSLPDVSTRLAPIEEQLAKQRQEKTRVENLLKVEAATAKQLDDISSAIVVLEKQLEAERTALNKSIAGAEAQIAATELQIMQLDDRLAKCRLKAPAAGTVLSKYARAGELTAAGHPLFKLADMEHVYLKSYVTSLQLAEIRLGQEAKVRADFGEGEYRHYDGKVIHISDKSEFTPKNIYTSSDRANMVYAVKIAVENDGYLKLGMYGDVKFLNKEEATKGGR